MSFLQAIDAIADDVPIKYLFINVGQEDPTSEAGEVGVFLNHTLGIENDSFLEVGALHLWVEGAAEFFFNGVCVDVEIEADGGKIDATLKVYTIPKVGVTVRFGHDDHGLLLRFVDGSDALFFTNAGAMSTIQDVSFSNFKLTLAHHLFLDGVLHIFDVDESLSAYIEAFSDSASDLNSWFGVQVEREECFAHSDLDLGFSPRYDLAIATDEADGDWFTLGSWCRFFAAKHKAAGDIVRVVFNERLFDKKVNVVRR